MSSSTSNMLETLTSRIIDNKSVALTKSLSIVFTQPLQVCLRAQQQSVYGHSKPLNLFNTFLGLKKQGPIRSFYRGGLPSATKELLKYGTYKMPLIKEAPNLVTAWLPSTFDELTPRKQHIVKSVTAGVFAGVSDTLLSGWLENYATFRATSQGKHANASFYSELQTIQSPLKKIERLYKGTLPCILKSSVQLTTFYALNQPIEASVKTIYQTPSDETASWQVKASVAVITGFSVALTSSPFDIVKTLSQMPASNAEPIHKTLNSVFKRHGVHGLSAGVGTKGCLVTLGWGINYLFFHSDPVSTPPLGNQNNSPRLN